ncbi:hypothetical protein F2P81_000063 [Scophthalmus maximus]|uniref:Uncharacterized protein n=1 Tax=Scophthalmus maximus TaxID=52904 RepID=A0A6A4TS75_SCOMX|nr:hypothetical protein F2P81_000063 [Scophthalmus maximus]
MDPDAAAGDVERILADTVSQQQGWIRVYDWTRQLPGSCSNQITSVSGERITSDLCRFSIWNTRNVLLL